MKEALKGLLKSIGWYHSLQGFYRKERKNLFRLYCRLRYASQQGSGYHCNACGRKYRQFVPEWPSPLNAPAINNYQVIAGYGEQVFCPGCLSTNRERLVIAVLSEMKIDGLNILHFAPEEKVYRHMASRATVTTADLEPGFYRLLDPDVRKADATRLDMADGSFDLVVANHIMEHIPDDKEALLEFHRVLRPQGIAILQTPWSKMLPATLEEPLINDPLRQMQLFGQQDHVRIYAYSDYLHRLASAGFHVQVMTSESMERFSQYAIQPGEDFLLCHKEAR